MPYWIKNIPYCLKMFFQKLFRANHISDNEIWSMYSYIVKNTLPRLQAFKKAKRVSFQVTSENYDYAGAYEEERQKLEIQRWETVLEKILFAFEFTYQENFSGRKAKRIEKKIKEKYGDWDAKTPDNKSYHFWKRKNNEMSELVSSPIELSKEDIARYSKEYGKDWAEKNCFYYNVELHSSLHTMANEGFELFGKYFQGLWD